MRSFEASARPTRNLAGDALKTGHGTGVPDRKTLRRLKHPAWNLTASGPQHHIHEQLHAVASHFGQDARQQPLLISSVTSQIGHTHGASGMASLIKAKHGAR